MFTYTKSFILKDTTQRQFVNFICYTAAINSAVAIYNSTCSGTPNKKRIAVVIHQHHLDFDIQSQKPLNIKYVGIALRLFSQILVHNCRFITFCTNGNPKKLFITI